MGSQRIHDVEAPSVGGGLSIFGELLSFPTEITILLGRIKEMVLVGILLFLGHI